MIVRSTKEGVTIVSMSQQRLLTYADLENMPDDNNRYEIIDGELFVSPAPRVRHQDVAGYIFAVMRMFVEEQPIGRVFMAPTDVVFDDRNVVEPDIVYIANERRGILNEKNIGGVPSLLVEVVSNSRMDRVRKRDLYAKFGVDEYWIIDPEADRVEILLRDGNHYAPPIIQETGSLSTTQIPDLKIHLARVFRRYENED